MRVGGGLTAVSAAMSVSKLCLPSWASTEICSRALSGPSYSQLKITPSTLLDFAVVNVVPVICDAADAGRTAHTLALLAWPDAGSGSALPCGCDPLACEVRPGELPATPELPHAARANAAVSARMFTVSLRGRSC